MYSYFCYRFFFFWLLLLLLLSFVLLVLLLLLQCCIFIRFFSILNVVIILALCVFLVLFAVLLRPNASICFSRRLKWTPLSNWVKPILCRARRPPTHVYTYLFDSFLLDITHTKTRGEKCHHHGRQHTARPAPRHKLPSSQIHQARIKHTASPHDCCVANPNDRTAFLTPCCAFHSRHRCWMP